MHDKAKRAHLIDMLRGGLIIYIVLYHLLYDLTVFFNVPMPFFWSKWFQSIRVGAVMALLYISGMVSECTRNGLRRAGKLLLCACVITAVSLAVLPNEPIYFGVIHLYAACALAYHFIGRFVKAPAPWIGAMFSLCAFMIFYNIGDGYLYFGNVLLALPKSLYSTVWLIPLGLPPRGFLSADYYPLLPWMLIFFSGAFYAKALKSGELPDYTYEPTRQPWLEKIGRNTLFIYMVHQPVILAVLYPIFWLLGSNK